MPVNMITPASSLASSLDYALSKRVRVIVLALSLGALASCRRTDANGRDSTTTSPATAIAPTDTIFSGCSGGFTGGGSETAITGRGEILVWQHQLAATRPDYRRVGTDSAAAAQLFGDLERTGFRTMKQGEPSNVTCVLAVTDARGRHEVLFTPGSVPARLQPIVKRIETLTSRASSDSVAAPRPADTTAHSLAAGPDSVANVVDAFARDDAPRGDGSSASASNQPTSEPTAIDTTAVSTAQGADAERAASQALVPLVRGLTLVSALHFPDGDRENRVRLTDVTAEGVTYDWYFDQHSSDGKQDGQGHYSRFVSANDLAGAPRLNSVFLGHNQEETPGYTAMTISHGTYSKVLALGETPYTVTNLEGGPGALASLLPSRLTYRGKLTLASRGVDSIPVLLDGRRTKLPTLHFHGAYTFQDKPLTQDYWVLADSTHPLLLKTVTGADVFQMIRIDLPEAPTQRVSTEEQELQKNCRMELPGVYFAFNSAELEPASEPAITSVATLLQRHPDWTLTIEGHTDSIGNPQFNQKLSVARAESVRAALVQRHGVAEARLSAAGFGATRPRESNATIEGRARNRRVELARSCAAGH